MKITRSSFYEGLTMYRKSIGIFFSLSVLVCLFSAFKIAKTNVHDKKNHSVNLQDANFSISDIVMTDQPSITQINEADELAILWNLTPIAGTNSVVITPSIYISDGYKYLLIDPKKYTLLKPHAISGPLVLGNQMLSSANITDAFDVPNTNEDFTSLTFTNTNSSGPIGYTCQVKDSQGNNGSLINTNPSPPKLKYFLKSLKRRKK